MDGADPPQGLPEFLVALPRHSNPPDVFLPDEPAMPFPFLGVDQEGLLVRRTGLATARRVSTAAQDVIHRADQEGAGVQEGLQEGVTVLPEGLQGGAGA
jgi:hypothetical protein